VGERSSLLGQTIGGCRVESLVGSGALGAVYRAHQVSLDRSVALKVLTARTVTKEQIKELFQEAKTLAAINHPNVVKVYDMGVAGGAPYIVMEYLDGETLHKRLERARRLPIEAVLKLAIEVACGLQAAHKQGIVHRDLKPSNVFLRPSAKLKLIDFGLAHRLGAERSGGGVQVSGGTPEFMAPEQWTFGTVDGRTDLYALGILIYRMMAGKLPFVAGTLEEMKRRHLDDALPAEGFSGDARGGLLFSVVQQLTRKTPGQRYPNTAALLDDLDRVQKGRAPKSAELCGAPLFCPVCETGSPPDARTCIGCGEALEWMEKKTEDLLPDDSPPPKPKALQDLSRRDMLRRRRLR
jgi:serine/threonine-protein kinase